jgi:hypothetical protein
MPSPSRAVLHIGLPKTATTSLQRHYFPFIPETVLTYIGTQQPRPRRPHPSYSTIMNVIESPPDVLDHHLNIARVSLAALPASKAILFSEEMITVDGHVPWQEKIRRLGMVFTHHPCTILVTVREPVSGLFSLYVELFRSLENRFPTFVDFSEGNQAAIYDYRFLTAILSDAFPETPVMFVPFENLQMGDSFLRQISDILQTQSPITHLPKENNTKNYRDSKILLPALTTHAALDRLRNSHPHWFVRKFCSATQTLLKPAAPLLRRIPVPWTTRCLSIPSADALPSRYADSNAWLLENYGINYLN